MMQLFMAVFILFTLFDNIATDVNVPIVVVNQKLIAHGQKTSVSLPEHLLKSEDETDPAILEAVHAALRNDLGFYGQVSLKYEKNAAKEITKINVTTPFKAEKNDGICQSKVHSRRIQRAFAANNPALGASGDTGSSPPPRMT
ncbi:hypothetical protein Ddc_18302 [Ditylenchus destructor]|nr:hypothetical protein Ddc_18302 [Ditylenchus destructor]